MNPHKDIAVTIAANAINKARTKKPVPVDSADPGMLRKVLRVSLIIAMVLAVVCWTALAWLLPGLVSMPAAAAGAFFFSRRDKSFTEARDKLGEKLTGYGERIKDGLSEARGKASAFFQNEDGRTQAEIAEEAESLKGTGEMLDSKARSNTKAGAVAY